MINRDYFINVLKLKEWETLDEAELYIDRAKKRVLALINVDFDFENDYGKYKETLDDCIVEYALFFSKNDYDLNSNSQSISFAGNSFSESRTIDEANTLNYVVKLLKKVGLIVDQAFDYVETFYDTTKQKINNVDLEKETKEKLTNLNIKVDNYLEKYYELKRQYEANFANLQSELQKLKDKKDEFNIETLKTIFAQITDFEKLKKEIESLRDEDEKIISGQTQISEKLSKKIKELEAKLSSINLDSFLKINEFESFKNELNGKLKTFENTKLKNDIERITSQITTIFDRLSKVETLQNEQKTKLETLSTKTINNENKISDIYNKLKNDTNINLYESLKELFNCLDASTQSENIKTIKDFQDLYAEDDSIVNLIFKDKDNNIAMYLKSEDGNNYFFDFSNATAETHFLKDHPFIDNDKLEEKLVKKQDKVDGLNFASNNYYSLIHYTKPQTNIRIGSDTNSGYKSNLFIDRDRDKKNIFRYIETNSKIFIILTPAMQDNTDIEIANDNGVKYISLKIDGEELKLTKEKLIKLRNLLN